MRWAVLDAAFTEPELQEYFRTQRLVLRSDIWHWIQGLHPTQIHEKIVRIALRELIRSNLDPDKNCIVKAYLNLDKPNEYEEITIARDLDGHMMWRRRREENRFIESHPGRALKSGSAGVGSDVRDTLNKRYKCPETYPETSPLSGHPMWDRSSVTVSEFVVTKAGTDGMVEGTLILRLHNMMRNTNIKPESRSSTEDGKTSLSRHRMFYSMSVSLSIGEDFVLLEMLSIENRIYINEPSEIRHEIDCLREKAVSDDDLREICHSRNIIVDKRDDITERGLMVLLLARDNVSKKVPNVNRPTSYLFVEWQALFKQQLHVNE